MNNKKEPLIHISKRDTLPWFKAWGIRIAAILLALVFCGIITSLLTKLNPLSVYATMFNGVFGTKRKIWVTLQNTSVLLLISLALTPAFKMKFWNVGGEGQVLIGGVATAACMIYLGGKIPNGLLIVVMLLAALCAGAIWAMIPALFKVKWNTNETLATLMMNYIATQIAAFYIIVWEVPKGSGSVGIINQATNAGWLPNIYNQYLLSIIVAVIATALLYVYQNYTKQGYEIAVVGESVNTARYVGIKVNRVVIRTLIISGAVCGLAGFIIVGGIDHTITTTLVGGRGFTAVMVSWLAKFNPIAMVATSFLINFMKRGASAISTKFLLNEAFGDILSAIIIFFIIGCEFFINYKLAFRKDKKEAK